jgi:hypothetical protein
MAASRIGIAVLAALCHVGAQPLGGLAVSGDGRVIYFVTDGTLRTRHSNQSFTRKVFALSDAHLAVVDEAQNYSASLPLNWLAFTGLLTDTSGQTLLIDWWIMCPVGTSSLCRGCSNPGYRHPVPESDIQFWKLG